MTYCVGIWTRHGLVMASDSHTNAGHDQVNVARKMHVFVQPAERVFILLSSGSLSCTQSIITLLRRDFEGGKGLAQAPSLYDAARVIGEPGRRTAGRRHDVLPLSGVTHMASQEVVAENLLLLQLAFLRSALGLTS